MRLSAITMLKGGGSVFGQHPSAEQDGLFKVPVESQADYRLTEETFLQYINTRFRIQISPLTAVNLELIRVSRRAPSSSAKPAKTPKLDCFSVVFRGPSKTALESKTYQVEHNQMGAFDLFIGPVNEHSKQRLYEAVFNRLEQ